MNPEMRDDQVLNYEAPEDRQLDPLPPSTVMIFLGGIIALVLAGIVAVVLIVLALL